MKAYILVLSLVANAALALVAVWPRASDAAGIRIAAGANAKNGGTKSKAPASASGEVAWRELVELDPRNMVAALQASGMPNSLIRPILETHLEARLAERRQQFMDRLPPVPYWKSPLIARSLVSDQNITSELRQMARQSAELVDELLGRNEGLANAMDRQIYGNISEESVRRIKGITADYLEMFAAARGETLGIPLPEDFDKLLFLEEERMKDFRAALGPAEFDEYQLRASSTANGLRLDLQAFNPTEAEFRALFALIRPLEMKYKLTPLPSHVVAQRTEDLKLLAQQIQEALGPERYAEYQGVISAGRGGRGALRGAVPAVRGGQ